MPPSPRHYRRLCDEFRNFVESRDAWPSLQILINFCDKNNVGFNKSEYASLKRGDLVPEKYSVVLAKLMNGRPTLQEYLSTRLGGSPTDLSIEKIVELIAAPELNYTSPSEGGVDWLMRGLDGIVSVFTEYFWGELIPAGTICRSEADVRKAVDMILTASGRHLADGDQSLSNEEAITLVENATSINRRDYLATVIESWSIVPWSIAFAVVSRERVGCCRILPLTEQAYEKIKAGLLCIDNCINKDIIFPTRTLFMDALGEISDIKYKHIEKRTRQQVRAIFLQIAHLTHNNMSAKPLRVLALAGTPTYEARAKKFGFRHVGTSMPGLNMKLMEMDLKKAVFVPMVIAELQRRLYSKPQAIRL